MIKLREFVQSLRELVAVSDRKVEKLVAEGEAALDDGQPVIAAIKFTDAYGILARMKDTAVIPFQLTIAKKLAESYSQQGETRDKLYWEETIVELQRQMKE